MVIVHEKMYNPGKQLYTSRKVLTFDIRSFRKTSIGAILENNDQNVHMKADEDREVSETFFIDTQKVSFPELLKKFQFAVLDSNFYRYFLPKSREILSSQH